MTRTFTEPPEVIQYTACKSNIKMLEACYNRLTETKADLETDEKKGVSLITLCKKNEMLEGEENYRPLKPQYSKHMHG